MSGQYRKVRQWIELYVVLVLAAGLVGWQLFVPPIVGLADQGDFLRLLGPLGYAPVPKGPEHKYYYLTREYVKDPTYRQPRWEQVSSELIIARVAIVLNSLFGNGKRFDITLFGLTHAVLFLLALFRILYVTRSLMMYRLIWALSLLVLTDVGYVAYWNSLYTEPSSCIWFLFFLAESVGMCSDQPISTVTVLRWTGFTVLWITAKAQNAALCVPLGIYGLGLMWRARGRKTQYAALAAVITLCLAGLFMYMSLLPATRVAAQYNLIFFAILPESQEPRADLKTLGLNPDYVRYSGTVAWSPDTGVADGTLVNAIQAKVSSLDLVGFYLRRPRRMWKHIEEVLTTSLSLRPEFCGNFDRSAGRLPGERSEPSRCGAISTSVGYLGSPSFSSVD